MLHKIFELKVDELTCSGENCVVITLYFEFFTVIFSNLTVKLSYGRLGTFMWDIKYTEFWLENYLVKGHRKNKENVGK